MMDFSKKLEFDFISLLKICLMLVGLGCIMTLLNESVAWIVVMGILFLAVFEASSMYYAYKGKPKGKEEKKNE